MSSSYLKKKGSALKVNNPDERLIRRSVNKKKKISVELWRKRGRATIWYVKVTPLSLRDFNRIKMEETLFEKKDEAVALYKDRVLNNWVSRFMDKIFPLVFKC